MICLLVSLTMVLSLCIPAAAVNAEMLPIANLSTEDTETYIIHESEKDQLIDDLFALRCQLETNFEENEDAILKIDNQLVQLGVEFITHTELANTLGYDALPLADVEDYDSGNTQWTSRRLVSTYRGQHYELQIIEGIPLNKHSCLRRSDVDVPVSDQQIIAGVTEIIKTIGISGLGGTPVPEIVDAITLLDTTFTIAGTVIETMAPSTIIEGVAGVAYITFSTHMKVVLVKPYQAADRRQQWLYTGNYVTYTVSHTWEVESSLGEHGNVGDHAYMKYTSTAASLYFDDYSIALQNYYSNKENTDFIVDYGIRDIELSIFNHQERFEVPFHSGLITIPQN